MRSGRLGRLDARVFVPAIGWTFHHMLHDAVRVMQHVACLGARLMSPFCGIIPDERRRAQPR
ncbi:MAG: hypothetical protein AB3N09_03205 [Tateyamaria sp.]